MSYEVICKRQPFACVYEIFFLPASNTNVLPRIGGLKVKLLKTVLDAINMTLVHVSVSSAFALEKGMTSGIGHAMFLKVVYIALGTVGYHCLFFHILTSPIYTEMWVTAGMCRVLLRSKTEKHIQNTYQGSVFRCN
jgi:hypothetical protein